MSVRATISELNVRLIKTAEGGVVVRLSTRNAVRISWVKPTYKDGPLYGPDNGAVPGHYRIHCYEGCWVEKATSIDGVKQIIRFMADHFAPESDEDRAERLSNIGRRMGMLP